MCGIAGIIGQAPESAIQRMVDSLAHRGPNDQGIYRAANHNLALGHTRLSIIDLSFAGHEPMSYDGGRYWISFNGEIYNYRELRRDLEEIGCEFRSNSDTEVLLAAYSRWGEGCLTRLRGMFAFAIWDSAEVTLFLARDRFGIKPLYYSTQNGKFIFASEIKALLASGLVSRRVNKQAIWDYLSIGSIIQPHTILAEVQSLPPAHSIKLRFAEDPVPARYWDIAKDTTSLQRELATIPYEDAVKQLRQHLENATRYHLISDVPVGAFLSGGIDSTAVVGLMTRLTSKSIQTYSIGFESDHQDLSELKWAKLAADRLGTYHTEVFVTAEDAASAIDKLVEAIDQPSLDGANTYFVSRAAAKEVTVSLSGLGGDELFAGYPQFRRIANSARRAPTGVQALQTSLTLLKHALPGRWYTELESLIASPLERLARVRRLMTDDQKERTVHSAFLTEFTPENLSRRYEPLLHEDLDPVALVSYAELRGYLADTLLRDCDAMSMAHSLEVRPVLLDHIFAEYAFSLPSAYKLNGGAPKRIFIDAIADILPKEIAERPKMGFEMPLENWLRTSLRPRAVAAFSSAAAETLFAPELLQSWRSEVTDRAHIKRQLWPYFVLLEFMEKYELELPCVPLRA